MMWRRVAVIVVGLVGLACRDTTAYAPDVLSLKVEPDGSSIGVIVGTQWDFAAVATFSDGSTAGVDSLAVWHVRDTLIATSGGNGIVTGRSIGNTWLIASYERGDVTVRDSTRIVVERRF